MKYAKSISGWREADDVPSAQNSETELASGELKKLSIGTKIYKVGSTTGRTSGIVTSSSKGKLTWTTIPENVTSIGTNAFTGRGKNLTIYGYMGSYAESFANSKGISFIRLLYPYITSESTEVNIGDGLQFTSTVYLDIDETTTAEGGA